MATEETAPVTMEIAPDAVVPASLAPVTATDAQKLTPSQQQLAENLKDDFIQSAQQDGADWNKEQAINDAMYKLYFGGEAFNAHHEAAYRESLQRSGQ